jgi:hypothetical protein
VATGVGVSEGYIGFLGFRVCEASALRRLVQIPRQAPIAVAYAIGTLPSLWFFERLGGVLF